MIEAGKKTIEGYVFSICRALNVPEHKEIVIYICGMSAEDVANFEDLVQPHKVSLPRFKE